MVNKVGKWFLPIAKLVLKVSLNEVRSLRLRFARAQFNGSQASKNSCAEKHKKAMPF